MPGLASSSGVSWLKIRQWLAATCLLLFARHIQGNVLDHQVNVWYTYEAPGDTIATLAQQSSIQEINILTGEYEYTDIPENPAPSGLQLHLDANLTHVRIEVRVSPTSADPYTDRLYVSFYWPLLEADLVTPTVLQDEAVSFQVLPPDTEVPFLDPGLAGLEFFGRLPEGGLLVQFANITAADAALLPPVMEFAYMLEIQPSHAPTAWPTFSPSTTVSPTLAPTTSAMPTPVPTSPSTNVPSDPQPSAALDVWRQLPFQVVGLASLVTAWVLT